MNRLRLGLGALALALACASHAEQALDGGIIVSAHRGGSAYAPENTLLAYRNAYRLGADDFETDTQLTADGQLVLIHDDSVDRTTNCSGNVIDMTYDELLACDAAYWFSPGQSSTRPDENRVHPLRGKDIRIPLASELFDYLLSLDDPTTTITIEIKDIPGESNFEPAGEAIATELVALIQQPQYAPIKQQIIVQSFWPPALDAVKRMDPEIRTLFLTTPDTAAVSAMNLAYLVARGHDIGAPNWQSPDFGPEFVSAAHAARKQVVPWTVDGADDLRAVAATGVDGIITNYPGCLLRLQGRLGAVKLTPAGVPDTLPCPAEASFPPVAESPGRPDPETCAALRPARWLPAFGRPATAAEIAGGAGDGASPAGPGQGKGPRPALRVVGIQYKQDVRHVERYASFRTKMRCLMEDHVVPLMEDGLPMLVVFNEDIGLMTLATGSRGKSLREQAATGLRAPTAAAGAPASEQPAGAALAIGQVNAAYAPQIAEYQRRFGPIDPRKQMFVAATDTLVRAFQVTFADIARDYGVYVVASNIQPRYTASSDARDIALFQDPDLGHVDEVYVATSSVVTNQTLLWGPENVDMDAPRGSRNLLFINDKVPVTPIEKDLIAVDEGPASGDAAKANAAGYPIAGFQLGFATSLPAFQWGYAFGEAPPAGFQPCADVRLSYMPCMDALGVDVVIQAEANPARWGTYQPGGWQPLEWMESTWRSVGDPHVGFRYNITPHLVGNLLDLVFDGQSAITARGAEEPLRHYVGNTEFDATQDPAEYAAHVGGKPEFLALAPWVTDDAPRPELIDTANRLAPGSGDALENDYLETAVWADLVH